MSRATPETIERGIDAVVRNASGQLIANDRLQALRYYAPRTVPLLLVVPLIALLVYAGRWAGNLGPGWFSWGWLSVLTVAVPLTVLMLRTYLTPAQVGRRRALVAVDRSLHSADRLVTADEFLADPAPNGFQQAAIEDAASWVAEGRLAEIGSPGFPGITLRRQFLLTTALAVLMLLAAFGLSTVAADATPEPSPQRPDAAVPVMAPVESKPRSRPAQADEKNQKSRKPQQAPRRKRPANRNTAPASMTPDGAEESRGLLTEGETSESQQSSNPSSAQGAPSSQGQPSKPGETTVRKKNRQKPRPNQREPKEQPEKKQEEPSGSTAGQGSSRGSNNNAAASDWSSRSQQSTPDDEDADNDEDAEDDDEEQESRGGVQPNMRDRRAPVNRDLNIGFGNARPNPDANGRGGPGGQKKSRGVASLILGVPIPDRITGQPNKGRTRITQQRITPEAEQTDQVTAESRGTRTGPVGPIHHPDFSPWLQDYVRRYFLKRREAADPAAPAADEVPSVPATDPAAP